MPVPSDTSRLAFPRSSTPGDASRSRVPLLLAFIRRPRSYHQAPRSRLPRKIVKESPAAFRNGWLCQNGRRPTPPLHFTCRRALPELAPLSARQKNAASFETDDWGNTQVGDSFYSVPWFIAVTAGSKLDRAIA
jgi:hypothetical protein